MSDPTLPGSINPTGTLDDLAVLRTKHQRLAQATTNLLAYEDTYEIGKEVRDRAMTLAATDFDVLVPCLLCTGAGAVTVLVGGDSEPRAILCGACDAAVEASVLTLDDDAAEGSETPGTS